MTALRGRNDASPVQAPLPAGRVSDDGLVLRCTTPVVAPAPAGTRLDELWEACCDRHPEALAVDNPRHRLTYQQLDIQANRLARHLHLHAGIGAGDRVGLLFSDPVDGYLAMLATLKLRAAYVPLDAAFPPERLAYIAADASLNAVLCDRTLLGALDQLAPTVTRVDIDALNDQLLTCRGARLTAADREPPADELAYVIYTSGTTGTPKGVAIAHGAIVNFVTVAAATYGMRASDRVYQGLTIAFDFAVEEIWVAWMSGATLVPKPAGQALLGVDLHEYLVDQRITALCCVPTLLATLPGEVPGLRFLLVSGESCPADLIVRWHRPDRRFLNVYGPTEATVSATWAVCAPGQPVTIGVPLPTYSILILDPETGRPLPVDQEGEIAIAGVGLADGYLGLPERTATAFVPDPVGLDDNPSGRIYRSGDLGVVNAAGEVEHRGRIDEQVKVRGYRIELGEIEAVLREGAGVGQAVVDVRQLAAGERELIGYYTVAAGGAVDPAALIAHLRERLPRYMVPSQLRAIDAVPMMPSGKVDRGALPDPDPTASGQARPGRR